MTDINNRIITIKKNKTKIYKQETSTSVYSLSVANGGTGITSYTTGDLIVATESTILSIINAVESGYVIISNGINTTPSYGKVNVITMITGILPVANGGSNLTTYTTGDLIYATGTNILNTLPDIAITNVLLSGGVGVAPSYGKVSLTSAVSGALPANNGGTGISSYTTGDLIYALGATILSKLSAIATGNILLSGGVGVAPSWGKVDLTTMITGILPLANGGTNTNTLNAGVLNYITTAGKISTLTYPGSDSQYLRGGSSIIIGVSFGFSYRIIQFTYTSTGSLIDCSTVIPDDNTIPQITEGDEILSQTMTPLYSNSIISINIVANCGNLTGVSCIALFRAGTSDALASSYIVGGTIVNNGKIIYNETSGGTSSITYSVRVGPSSGNCYINGSTAGSARFGGVCNTAMFITESVL
jgi:hypothetical protein